MRGTGVRDGRHRVVVLGGGYAGLPAAKRLARQVRANEVRVTLVSALPDFLERPRLHQLATGQRVRRHALGGFLAPAGVEVMTATVTGVDLARRRLLTADDAVPVPYDTLVYAVGSHTDTATVPGAAEHAHVFAGPGEAGRLRERAAEVGARGGALVVVGGGLTGIEAATEFAAAFPGLRASLVSRDVPGHWWSRRARAHLARSLDRLGVEVRAGGDAGGGVAAVEADALRLADGRRVPFDVCLWAGGFAVPALAREAGLGVDGAGRVLVDRTLRSLSHFEVYAAGDAAAVSGPWGEALAMGCRSGGFTGPYVADAVARRLAGREPRPFTFRYVHECVSLGRGDAVVQFLHADESPHRFALRGRVAAWYKDVVLSSAIWLFRRPGPYVPRRRVRLAGERRR